MPGEYLARHDEADVSWHAGAAWRRSQSAANVSMSVSGAGRELSVCVVLEEHRDATAFLCTALTAAGLGVVQARVYVRVDERRREVVASFDVVRTTSDAPSSNAEIEARVLGALDDLVARRATMAELLLEHAETLRPGPIYPTEVEVVVAEDGTSVLQVVSVDRVGILAAIAGALAGVGVVATSADVATFSGLAVDRFQIEGEDGRPVDPSRHETVREAVAAAIEAVHQAYC